MQILCSTDFWRRSCEHTKERNRQRGGSGISAAAEDESRAIVCGSQGSREILVNKAGSFRMSCCVRFKSVSFKNRAMKGNSHTASIKRHCCSSGSSRKVRHLRSSDLHHLVFEQFIDKLVEVVS